jgi:hypothetical protein
VELIKSFCRGVQGGQFFQKAPPLAAGGKSISTFIYIEYKAKYTVKVALLWYSHQLRLSPGSMDYIVERENFPVGHRPIPFIG